MLAVIEPLTSSAIQQKVVEVGHARVFDLPAVESYPAPSVTWYRRGSPLSGTQLKYYVTLQNQLVILDAVMS